MGLERTSGSGMSRRRLVGTAMAASQVAAGVAVLAATGCAPAQGGVPPAPSASGLTGTASLLVRTNNNENKYQSEAVVPALRQQFPNLTVEVVAVPAGDAYLDKYTALQAGGTPPEVFSAYGTGFPDYYFIGGVADLSGYIARDKVDLNTYLPQVKDVIDTVYKRGGRIYALPNFTSHGWFVLYNTNMLAQAGLRPPPVDWEDRSWTWDVFLDYARQADPEPRHAGRGVRDVALRHRRHHAGAEHLAGRGRRLQAGALQARRGHGEQLRYTGGRRRDAIAAGPDVEAPRGAHPRRADGPGQPGEPVQRRAPGDEHHRRHPHRQRHHGLQVGGGRRASLQGQ